SLALRRYLRRPARQALDLRLDGLAALRQTGEMALRRLGAGLPGMALLPDGAQALAPGFRLAAQALGGAAAFDEMAALLGQRRLQLGQARAGLAQIGQTRAFLGHRCALLLALRQAGIGGGGGLIQGREPAVEL